MSVGGGPIHAAATFSTAVLRTEYEYERSTFFLEKEVGDSFG